MLLLISLTTLLLSRIRGISMQKRKKIILLLFIITVIFNGWQQPVSSRPLNVYEKIKLKRDIHYLVIGDSIGRGSGVSDRSSTWFEQWEDLMKKKDNIELKRHSIVQSGATAYEGLYLFKKTKKPPSVDLVFIIFGENDRKYMDEKQFTYYYEFLIRDIKHVYPETEIITITENCLDQELFAAAIQKLASHYHANHIDMRIPFKTSAPLTADGIHPNRQGYQLYAQAIYDAVHKGVSQYKQPALLADPSITRSRLSVKEIKDYQQIHGSFLKRKEYLWTQESGASLSYVFRGTNLGVNVLAGKEGGNISVYIDGRFVRNISTRWPVEKNRMLYVESGLSNREHIVTFTFNDKAFTNPSVKQTMMRLSSIVVFN
jgi:lysophospholipase L1-like esterase